MGDDLPESPSTKPNTALIGREVARQLGSRATFSGSALTGGLPPAPTGRVGQSSSPADRAGDENKHNSTSPALVSISPYFMSKADPTQTCYIAPGGARILPDHISTLPNLHGQMSWTPTPRRQSEELSDISTPPSQLSVSGTTSIKHS